MSRRRGLRREAARLWGLTAALFVLLAVSVSALGPLLQGIDWWTEAVVVAAVILAASAGVRSTGVQPGIGTPVGLAAGLLLVVLIHAPTSGFAFIVPTGDTVVAFRDLMSAGFESVYRQSTPAEADAGIRFLVTVAVGILAVLFDLIAVTLRQAAFVGALAAIVAVTPGIVTGDVLIWPLGLCAVAYLIVLWVDTRIRRTSQRRSRGVMVIGATAVVGALVLSVAAPGFNGAALIYASSGQVALQGISPLVDLGQDLRQPGGVEQFRYITNTTRPLYFRLLTLDRFDGTTWSPGDDPETQEYSPDTVLPVPGLDAATPVEPVETSVDIRGMRSRWLPVPFPSVQVTGVDGRWEWDVDGLTLSSPVSSTAGQEYVAEGVSLRPTREQLATSRGVFPADVQAYLDLPEEMPEIIQRTLDEVTAGLTSDYDKAFALQQFFRAGEFAYSEEAPVEQGYDGDGYGVIATFLEKKSGYCVHFASAMAIMSRLAGIPARVSLGYVPGDRLGSTADQRSRYSVATDDLHAWPELYFSGVGWIPFEPTAGRGVVPEYALQVQDEQEVEEVPAAPNPATTAPQQTGAPEQHAGTQRNEVTERETAPVLLGWALAVVALVLFVVPGAIRMTRRRARLRALRGGRAGPRVAWQDLDDHARDLGRGAGSADTPRAFAAALERHARFQDAERTALGVLLDAVEHERFAASRAGADGPALADAVSVVGRALTREATPAARVRSVVFPASVLTPRALPAEQRAAGV